jgi:hypothetical protein
VPTKSFPTSLELGLGPLRTVAICVTTVYIGPPVVPSCGAPAEGVKTGDNSVVPFAVQTLHHCSGFWLILMR